MIACKDSRISETEYDMTKQVPIDDDAAIVESDDGAFKSVTIGGTWFVEHARKKTA